MKRYSVLALAGLIFGLVFGFTGVCLDHSSDGMLPILVDLPGTFAAMFTWNYDWSIDEEWTTFLWPITAFNGLFWMFAFPIFAFLRDIVRLFGRHSTFSKPIH